MLAIVNCVAPNPPSISKLWEFEDLSEDDGIDDDDVDGLDDITTSPNGSEEVIIKIEKNILDQSETVKKDQPEQMVDETYKCDKCDAVFNLPQSLRFHRCISKKVTDISKNIDSNEIKVLKEFPKYKCEICTDSFTSNEILEKHKKNHSPKVKHKCDKCQTSFNLPQALTYHKCNTIVKVTTTSNPIVDQKPFKCNICGIGFTRELSLKGHRLTKLCNPEADPLQMKKKCKAIEDDTDVRIIQICNVCGEDFKNPASLRRHKNFKCSEKTHICNVCGKTFCTETNLKLHIPKDCNPLILPESNFEFPIKEENPMDFDEAVKDRSVESIIVDSTDLIKDSTFDGILVNLTSNNERPYKCDVCDKDFLSIAYLKAHHRRVHSKDKVIRRK